LAWVLAHPDCFAYGADGEAVLVNLPQASHDYGNWIAAHGAERWLPDGPLEIAAG
jgi:hypothetical protein